MQDAEIVTESTALAVRPEPTAVSLFGAAGPVEIVTKATEVADALKAVLKRQGLISNISGKEYPRCEAWTLLGTMLGVFPVLSWTKEIGDGEGWEARVEAKMRDGTIVGAAEAECLRSERNWSNRDDFALRSMAQTRATAKALRMPLGFVMTLAGYEATPAEEMHFERPKNGTKPVEGDLDYGNGNSTEAAAEAAMGKALQKAADGFSHGFGTVKLVSSKSGTKKNGQPWTRYGVKINEDWYNTFDRALGEQADGLRDQTARFSWKMSNDGKSKDLLSVEAATEPF